jgi:hypothetical protein
MESIRDVKLQPYLSRLNQAIDAYKDSMRASGNQGLCKLLDSEVKMRNRALKDLREQVEGETGNGRQSELYRKAAALLPSESSLSALSEKAKTDEIERLLDKFESQFGEDELEKGGLYELLGELSRANWGYVELSKARGLESSGLYITRLNASASEEARQAYEEAVRFLNALLIYNGDEECADEIDELNQLIDSFKTKRNSIRPFSLNENDSNRLNEVA